MISVSGVKWEEGKKDKILDKWQIDQWTTDKWQIDQWTTYLWKKDKTLSRASEVGSPTNQLGSRQRQDTGPGILWSVNRWKKNGPYTGPVLLRQGEPGTPQYDQANKHLLCAGTPISHLLRHTTVEQEILTTGKFDWEVRDRKIKCSRISKGSTINQGGGAWPYFKKKL